LKLLIFKKIVIFYSQIIYLVNDILSITPSREKISDLVFYFYFFVSLEIGPCIEEKIIQNFSFRIFCYYRMVL